MLPLHLLHSKYFQWTLWERTWLSIIKSICDFRLFWGTQFRRSLKCSWSKKLPPFVHKQVCLTLCHKSREISKSRIREFVAGTILTLLSCTVTQGTYSHPQPPCPLRERWTMLNNQGAPRRCLLEKSFGVTQYASAQVWSKPWTSQWYLAAMDLLVLLLLYLSTQSRLIYLHKCSSSYYHTPHSRNEHRAIKIKMLKTVNRFLLWTQALIFFLSRT